MAEVTVSIDASPISVTVSSAQGPAGSGSGATVVDAVTNGEANAVSSNAVFDALALKAPLISPTFTTPALGTPSSGTLTNCTFPTLNQNTTGNAATVTTNANLTGPVTSTGNATAIANGAISNAMLANAAVANLSGTNTGDETAARIATALNAGTEDATAADTDKLAVTHPAGGWMLLSTLWTWIKAKIDAGMTIAGAQAFSSTTRPTSAGTGTPAETSLITRADGDTRFVEKDWVIIPPAYFVTSVVSGGSVSTPLYLDSVSTAGGAARAALYGAGYYPFMTRVGVAKYSYLFNDTVEINGMFSFHSIQGTGVVRFLAYQPQAGLSDEPSTAVKTIGFEVVGVNIRALVSDGSALSYGSNYALTNDRTVDLTLSYNPTTRVLTLSVDGTVRSTASNGPTGAETGTNPVVSFYAKSVDGGAGNRAIASLQNIRYRRKAP